MSSQTVLSCGWRPVVRRVGWAAGLLLLVVIWAGCVTPGPGGGGPDGPSTEPEVSGLLAFRPELMEAGLGVGSERGWLRGARNEWVDLVVVPVEGGLADGPGELGWSLRRAGDEQAGPEDPAAWEVRAYRVEWVPCDTRGVNWVRQVGPGSASAALPRALVPLEAVRGRPGWFVVPPGTRAVYVEWRVPLESSAGRYSGGVWWTSAGRSGRASVGLPLDLRVDDLTLTGSPDLTLVGMASVSDLARIWPAAFARVEPRLLSRLDAAHLPAIERMDQIVRLARENRVDVVFPELQPTVKMTPREGLRLDWAEYDSVVMPWLRGEVAGDTPSGRDGVGGVTLLPVSDWLAGGGGGRLREDVQMYWQAVVSHFDQQRLLGQVVAPPGTSAEWLGGLASERVRWLAESVRDRGLVSLRGAAWEAALRSASDTGGETARRWAAMAGPVAPLAGGGRGVRAAEPDPTRTVWFYPASMFLQGREVGGKAVVPGLALKWARRAQQDWELIDLAYRRGGRQVVLSVLQTLTARPDAGDEAAIGADLLSPPADLSLWEQGLSLIRDAAVSRDPTIPRGASESAAWMASEQAELRRWQLRAEVPRLLATGSAMVQRAAGGGVELRIRLTPSEPGTARRLQTWPAGWSGVRLEGDEVRAEVAAETPVKAAASGLLAVEAISGPGETAFVRELVLPVVWVAASRGPADRIEIDGALGDWTAADLVHSGGLVRMLDTTSAQAGKLLRSDKDTRLLMRWQPDALCVAVRVSGVASRAGSGSTNFARETAGRSTGEDLCRLILRTPQRELWLLLKPTGLTVERGAAGTDGGEGGGTVAYAALTDTAADGNTAGDAVWRAELRIPASLLGGPLTELQAIEVNLIRHDGQTGESASWAGPIDRDDQRLRGIVILGPR